MCQPCALLRKNGILHIDGTWIAHGLVIVPTKNFKPINMNDSIFFYRNNGTYQRIDLDEVFALETAKNYVNFYTPASKHIVRISMEKALKKLKDRGFVQIHRYFAVALPKIHVIDKENVYFSMDKEDCIPITKSHYTNLIKQLRMLCDDDEPETN